MLDMECPQLNFMVITHCDYHEVITIYLYLHTIMKVRKEAIKIKVDVDMLY